MDQWVVWRYRINVDKTMERDGECVSVHLTEKGATQKVKDLKGKEGDKIKWIYRIVAAELQK